MNDRTLYAVFLLAWVSFTFVGLRVFGVAAIASFFAAVLLAWSFSRFVADLPFEWLEHPLARDAALSFLGVFVGSLAASIGLPLFGAMIASACAAIALVRSAAWLAMFGSPDE